MATTVEVSLYTYPELKNVYRKYRSSLIPEFLHLHGKVEPNTGS